MVVHTSTTQHLRHKGRGLMSSSLYDIMECISNFKNNKKEWEKKSREKEREWRETMLWNEFTPHKVISP